MLRFLKILKNTPLKRQCASVFVRSFAISSLLCFALGQNSFADGSQYFVTVPQAGQTPLNATGMPYSQNNYNADGQGMTFGGNTVGGTSNVNSQGGSRGGSGGGGGGGISAGSAATGPGGSTGATGVNIAPVSNVGLAKGAGVTTYSGSASAKEYASLTKKGENIDKNSPLGEGSGSDEPFSIRYEDMNENNVFKESGTLVRVREKVVYTKTEKQKEAEEKKLPNVPESPTTPFWNFQMLPPNIGQAFYIGTNTHLPNLMFQQQLDIQAFEQIGLRGGLNSLRALLDKVTSIDMQTQFGNSMMIYSVVYGNYDAMLLLIYRGADVNLQNDYGVAPLHIATYTGDEVATIILIENGAKTNITDINGMTPLMYATSRNDLFAIRRLVENGADVDFSNYGGVSAMDIGFHINDAVTIKYLQDHSFIFRNASRRLDLQKKIREAMYRQAEYEGYGGKPKANASGANKLSASGGAGSGGGQSDDVAPEGHPREDMEDMNEEGMNKLAQAAASLMDNVSS